MEVIGAFYQFDALHPFIHWGVIMLSYYFSKICIKECFVEDKYYLDRATTIMAYVFTLLPALGISTIVCILVKDTFFYLKIYLEILVPCLISCIWNIRGKPLPNNKVKSSS